MKTGQLPDFKLERYFAAYEFEARFSLCSSDCESWTIAELLALEADACGHWEKLRLGYTESQGDPALRRAICTLYQTIQPDQILVHSGAEEAIFLFMQVILGPGDHVIVQCPCYQSLMEVARHTGCRVTPWQGREEDGWSPDVDELKRLIGPDTRLIVLNTPHNPTGYHFSRQAFQEINRIAQERGIILFCDEVYRESEYQPADRLPGACDFGDHAVSLGVMSKTYGLAGLRIGWIATQNRTIYQKIAALKDYTTICNSAPSEFLAGLALRNRGVLIERNLAIITRNLALLDAFFKRHADRFVWQPPKAGPIAFPRLLGGDIETLCEDLMQAERLLLLPGTLFDDRRNRFRIGFGRKNLPDALAHLERFLQRYRF